MNEKSVLASRPWHRIAMLLGSLMTPLDEAPKRLHSAANKDNLLVLADEMKQIEEESKKEIDSAIFAWTGETQPIPLQGLAGAILQSRIHAAYSLALSLSMLDSKISMKVFPHPEVSDVDVVRFLLTEWWNEHGRFRIAALGHSWA